MRASLLPGDFVFVARARNTGPTGFGKPRHYITDMLAMTEGGCERTEHEFARLFESAGLELRKIHPMESLVCVIEAAYSICSEATPNCR